MRRAGHSFHPSARISPKLPPVALAAANITTLFPQLFPQSSAAVSPEFLIGMMRLEIPATSTKHSSPVHSNRPYFAIFLVDARTTSPAAKISNQQNASRLEFTATPTKHSPQTPPNRPFFQFFKQCDD
jgi:hypothetical protein